MNNIKNLILAAALASASFISKADDFGILPTVTVTDDYDIDFNGWGGYSPWFYPESYYNAAIMDWIDEYRGTHQEAATLAAISHILKSSSVCYALVSGNAKSTTSTSDLTSRWLAAQEVFNFINNSGNLAQYREITRTLTFIINGKRYNGFAIAYADGVRETWPINPGYSTSSVKLLDQPLPNSQEPYKGTSDAPKCNQG
ncbi:MAG: hypothetical protein PHI55_03745 [Burkholderiaceae bacterium]|nr:hypothetical protein [Burkholderiaceae bacterium]